MKKFKKIYTIGIFSMAVMLPISFSISCGANELNEDNSVKKATTLGWFNVSANPDLDQIYSANFIKHSELAFSWSTYAKDRKFYNWHILGNRGSTLIRDGISYKYYSYNVVRSDGDSLTVNEGYFRNAPLTETQLPEISLLNVQEHGLHGDVIKSTQQFDAKEVKKGDDSQGYYLGMNDWLNRENIGNRPMNNSRNVSFNMHDTPDGSELYLNDHIYVVWWTIEDGSYLEIPGLYEFKNVNSKYDWYANSNARISQEDKMKTRPKTTADRQDKLFLNSSQNGEKGYINGRNIEFTKKDILNNDLFGVNYNFDERGWYRINDNVDYFMGPHNEDVFDTNHTTTFDRWTSKEQKANVSLNSYVFIDGVKYGYTSGVKRTFNNYEYIFKDIDYYGLPENNLNPDAWTLYQPTSTDEDNDFEPYINGQSDGTYSSSWLSDDYTWLDNISQDGWSVYIYHRRNPINSFENKINFQYIDKSKTETIATYSLSEDGGWYIFSNSYDPITGKNQFIAKGSGKTKENKERPYGNDVVSSLFKEGDQILLKNYLGKNKIFTLYSSYLDNSNLSKPGWYSIDDLPRVTSSTKDFTSKIIDTEFAKKGDKLLVDFTYKTTDYVNSASIVEQEQNAIGINGEER